MIANRSDTGYVRPERFDYDWGEAVSPREAPAYDVSAPEATGRQVQRLVALFQMTYVGTPMVYYGTEAGMWGADDPDDRKPMVWPDRRYAVEDGHPLGRDRPPDPVSFDDDLFRTYQTLIALRKQNAALRRGGFSVLQADDDRRLFAFARATGGPAVPVVVVINRSGEAHSTRIALPDSLQGAYEPIYRTPAPADPRVQQDASGLVLEVPPRSGLVLRRRPDGGP
jgi:glycosidase